MLRLGFSPGTPRFPPTVQKHACWVKQSLLIDRRCECGCERLFFFVGPAKGWRPIQGVPRLSPESWDEPQQTPTTQVWINQVQEMIGWMDGWLLGNLMHHLVTRIRITLDEP